MTNTKLDLDLATVLEEYGSDEFPPWRFDTPLTGVLKRYADSFEDHQRVRKAAEQRGQPAIVKGYEQEEKEIAAFLAKALKQHPVWDFLAPLNGLKTALAARVISEIGHPGRFPGQKCDNGHYFVSMFEPGAPCPALIWPDKEKGVRAKNKVLCGAPILPPRIKKDMTGVRSLWHFAGLHTVSDCCGAMRSYDGECERCGHPSKGISPTLTLLKNPDGSYRKRDWNPKLRTLIMKPTGIADQIVTHKPEPYYSVHPTNSYIAKLRHKAAEAGVALDAKVNGKTPVELIRAKGIARKVAAKMWIADLFTAWKQALEVHENVA